MYDRLYIRIYVCTHEYIDIFYFRLELNPLINPSRISHKLLVYKLFVSPLHMFRTKRSYFYIAITKCVKVFLRENERESYLFYHSLSLFLYFAEPHSGP